MRVVWASESQIGIATGPFEEKAVIARFTPANAEVYLKPGPIGLGVVLGEGLPGAGQDPGPYLAQLSSLIGLAIFEPLATYL